MPNGHITALEQGLGRRGDRVVRDAGGACLRDIRQAGDRAASRLPSPTRRSDTFRPFRYDVGLAGHHGGTRRIDTPDGAENAVSTLGELSQQQLITALDAATVSRRGRPLWEART
ncbi:hypothetical protein SAMN05660350_00009 [Geodermatophilus obscurus]|uniref:Uncharacterized protein n=1 Tax=Geodermatophilus obscurus TaxID=1861 RepID=A0A1M7RRJ6_9ACTN|nr:hypothetical protein SAMN05660350_00009 [Geodermatophilus obscurus]